MTPDLLKVNPAGKLLPEVTVPDHVIVPCPPIVESVALYSCPEIALGRARVEI
jgi:hypothetical protein